MKIYINFCLIFCQLIVPKTESIETQSVQNSDNNTQQNQNTNTDNSKQNENSNVNNDENSNNKKLFQTTTMKKFEFEPH